MSEFLLPDPVAFQLQGLHSPVHLVDATGKTLGTFVPKVELSQFEVIEPKLTDEQLQSIESSTEWYSTAEVKRHLESLR